LTLHIEFCLISNGILKRECGVLPPGNNSATIPDEAATSAILPDL
jgi:hypothetical protein